MGLFQRSCPEALPLEEAEVGGLNGWGSLHERRKMQGKLSMASIPELVEAKALLSGCAAQRAQVINGVDTPDQSPGTRERESHCYLH